MDIIEILKLGLPGLVFLLSLLSFKLLSQETQKKSPKPSVLFSIRHYMYGNLALAILTASAPITENWIRPSVNQFESQVKINGVALVKGEAAVCQGVHYGQKYLLVVDNESPERMVQVFAKLVIPCPNNQEHIQLSEDDTLLLGWDSNSESNIKLVMVSVAPDGQMFAVKS